MSKTDKKKRKLAGRVGEPFIPLRRRMVQSAAWRSLSAPAIKLYCELRLRYRHSPSNNGELFLSYRECIAMGLTRGSAGRAFAELQAKGFIVMTRRGEAGALSKDIQENGGCCLRRLATTWALTEEQFRGQLATHAYERWHTEKKPPRGSNGGTIKAPPPKRPRPPLKQKYGPASGTRMVPPVGPSSDFGPASGTVEGGSGADLGPAGGTPLSTISRGAPEDAREPHSSSAASEGGNPPVSLVSCEAGTLKGDFANHSPATVKEASNGCKPAPQLPPRQGHLLPAIPGARIREARKARGWTQARLAAVAGTHQPIVGKIERDVHEKVGAATRQRVIEALGLGAPDERAHGAAHLPGLRAAERARPDDGGLREDPAPVPLLPGQAAGEAAPGDDAAHQRPGRPGGRDCRGN